ncbi:hypothetical protein [Nocardia lasii]|uniref:Uncharacterized protein n=1 Tax=Nocardia lasii TaxID=1616107 RepID=A0ABW1JTE6_9NOCA
MTSRNSGATSELDLGATMGSASAVLTAVLIDLILNALSSASAA